MDREPRERKSEAGRVGRRRERRIEAGGWPRHHGFSELSRFEFRYG